MSSVSNLIIHILANATAIFVADKLLSGFSFRGSWIDLIIAATIMGLVNAVLRPIVKMLALPAIILTLGLFSLVINIAMLFLVAKILPTLQITGLWAAFWGTIIISLVNHLVWHLAKQEK